MDRKALDSVDPPLPSLRATYNHNSHLVVRKLGQCAKLGCGMFPNRLWLFSTMTTLLLIVHRCCKVDWSMFFHCHNDLIVSHKWMS
jgi:hypothetical protein